MNICFSSFPYDYSDTAKLDCIGRITNYKVSFKNTPHSQTCTLSCFYHLRTRLIYLSLVV